MRHRTLKRMKDFLRTESASGIVLLGAALLALIAVNTPLRPAYDALMSTMIGVSLGAEFLRQTLQGWINDGLMAVFFLLVALEIKREWLHGHLAKPGQALLPVAGAMGGVALPALIYAWMHAAHPETLRGWAIPTATDIAFSLGVLALLGSRVPQSLKIFLTALAVIDDLVAIVIIAFFYTDHIQPGALMVAGGAVAALVAMNRFGLRKIWPYLVVGFVLWLAMHASGVHATIGGVLLGLCIPADRTERTGWGSPLERLEHGLHPWVAFGIMPLFAFANAGLVLSGLHAQSLALPVPLSIITGLVLGKPLGILAMTGLCMLLGLAPMPQGANWRSLGATAMVAGIGFTMSLFLSGLAFPGDAALQEEARLGILAGSILSALLAYAAFRLVPSKKD